MPVEFSPVGVTVWFRDLFACRHPVLYSETHPGSARQVPKQARLRTNSEVSMWACSKRPISFSFVITDCHTACISVQQDHLFSAVGHNAVSSAKACRRMCARIVVITFRCKTQHYHYCGCELPLACFLVRPRPQLSLAHPLDAVHQSWSHVSLSCAPNRISGLKLKDDIDLKGFTHQQRSYHHLRLLSYYSAT